MMVVLTSVSDNDGSGNGNDDFVSDINVDVRNVMIGMMIIMTSYLLLVMLMMMVVLMRCCFENYFIDFHSTLAPSDLWVGSWSSEHWINFKTYYLAKIRMVLVACLAIRPHDFHFRPQLATSHRSLSAPDL